MGSIIFHGDPTLTLFVELCPVVVNTEMISIVSMPVLPRRWNADPILVLTIESHEGLGTKETVGQVFMNHHSVSNWKKVAIIVKSFPICSAYVFNGEATGNATKKNGLREATDAFRVNIRERVGARIGAPTVNNASEGVWIVPC